MNKLLTVPHKFQNLVEPGQFRPARRAAGAPLPQPAGEPAGPDQPQLGKPPLLLSQMANPQAEEQCRILCTKLFQSPRDPSVVVVSSASSGDGKTVTAVHLAATLALRTENQVLLLEADLRRPSLSKYLGLPSKPGLAGLLDGSSRLEETLYRVPQVPNLWVLPAGDSETSPAELLASPRWAEVTARLRRLFRHIVIDSPPVGVVTDFDLISTVCDGVILVIRPNHSNRTQAFEATNSAGKKLIGVVMNAVQDWWLWKRPKSYYHYYSENGSGKTQ
jgi:capsular exopolysaccharide synthesis family protein